MKTSYSIVIAVATLLVACNGSERVEPGTDSTSGCSGGCANNTTFLSVADVQRVIAQGVAQAQALNAQATIAVVDRVGNVLAVYRMGAPSTRRTLIGSAFAGSGTTLVSGGLEGIRLPVTPAPVNLDDQAAIAKALTAAYLSSEGNAFSTRTASQIVQEHFNVGESLQASGPLFGVQFSQLACSDIMRSFNGVAPSVGPQRSPLGLAADPGGFPLYKSGTVVGGVGVLADGVYGLDQDITDRDRNLDELIAYAASFGFAAPLDRRADRITVDGRTLRFSDVELHDLPVNPANAPAFATIPPAVGTLVATADYSNGSIQAGRAFGQPSSGIRPDTENYFPGTDAFVLVDAANVPRYPPRSGTDGVALGSAVLTQLEVTQVLRSALTVANRARAQIRRPLGSTARVTIAVVDTQGAVLGLVRSRDAPVFGIDVSVQKARSAAFLSSTTAATFLAALPNARYLATSDASVGFPRTIALGDYVTATRAFLGLPNALGADSIAFSGRAIGNIARPHYPDGIEGTPPGPLSKPAGEWSVFSTGLQLDLSLNAILQHVLHVAGTGMPDVTAGCAGVNLISTTMATQTVTNVRLGNGLQIFAGGVPIYRGNTLVGAIGVSGDGIDQDDMIAFLGLHEASAALGGVLNNAPTARRADTQIPRGVRLRYVQCPQAPYVDSTEDNVCAGK